MQTCLLTEREVIKSTAQRASRTRFVVSRGGKASLLRNGKMQICEECKKTKYLIFLVMSFQLVWLVQEAVFSTASTPALGIVLLCFWLLI